MKKILTITYYHSRFLAKDLRGPELFLDSTEERVELLKDLDLLYLGRVKSGKSKEAKNLFIEGVINKLEIRCEYPDYLEEDYYEEDEVFRPLEVTLNIQTKAEYESELAQKFIDEIKLMEKLFLKKEDE